MCQLGSFRSSVFYIFQADDVMDVAVDKINGLLESFMGINDTDLGMYMYIELRLITLLL